MTRTVPVSPTVKDTGVGDGLPAAYAVPEAGGKFVPISEIMPITTFNDWVVVAPFPAIETVIALPGESDYRNIGLVVGKSSSIMAPNGDRVESALEYGMVVLFQKRAVVDDKLKINKGQYAGKRLVLLSEKNVIMQLPAVPVKVLLDQQIGHEDFAESLSER